MALSIAVRGSGRTVVIQLTGEIDLGTLPVLNAAITTALEYEPRPVRVVIDLAHVTYLDCAGIGVLLAGGHRAWARDIQYRVRNPRGMVANILTLTDTLDYLTRASTPRRLAVFGRRRGSAREATGSAPGRARQRP